MPKFLNKQLKPFVVIGMILIPTGGCLGDAYTQFEQCEANPEVCLSIAKLQNKISALETKTQALKAEKVALANQPENTLRTLKEEMVIFQDRLKDGGFGPHMVMIPAGRFRMGDNSEKHRHEVSVARFAMGKHEVTVRKFRQFVNATGYKTEAEKGDGCYSYKKGKLKKANWHNSYLSQNDNHPVVCISWNDANAYAEWLSQQTGQKYRLPTEAEWEYAADGTLTLTARYWGKNPDDACGYANVHDITSKKENGFSWTHHNCTDGYAKTAPVGHFKPNNFGLYDMLGNVWEWTCSEYSSSYNGSEKSCKENAHLRVIRGGSWNYKPRSVRVTSRYRISDDFRDVLVGFRLARH